MNDLQLFEALNISMTDSRDMAVMVEKDYKHKASAPNQQKGVTQ